VAGENLAVRSRLADLTGLSVVVDNDANCAALAEMTCGTAAGESNAIVLTLGTGIGAGIIIDGAVYRGRSFAGEVGHMTMVPDGDPCECGRRGCWETLVSGSRFASEARRLALSYPDGILAGISGSTPDATHLGLSAAQGDLDAELSIRQAGIWLGRGLANLVALFDPGLFVIGGAAMAVGEILLAAARQEAGRAVEGSEHRPPVRIEAGRLGPLAGAIGAALLLKAPLKP
jgi:glucokinase